MIGRMNITAPAWTPKTEDMVEGMREKTGQNYASINHLGLAGSPDLDPRLRLYAGYQHVSASPEDGPQWLGIAATHAELGEFDKAEEIINEMKRLGGMGLIPQVYQEDLDVNLAHIFAVAGEYEKALDLFAQLEKSHKGHPIYHYVRASLYHAVDDFENAMREYAEAVRELQEQREFVEDEMDVDAIINIILACSVQAESGEPFDGTRPLELSMLLEEQDI
ncbi:MAG: tetratricopeptide repeat protein [Planctomycetes bacterium]|nr:tetratricopeptide repeat protein [Planctomycetota bacterium]